MNEYWPNAISIVFDIPPSGAEHKADVPLGVTKTNMDPEKKDDPDVHLSNVNVISLNLAKTFKWLPLNK